MFGNILSDAEIIRMRDAHILTLEPFDVRRLKVAHYKLTPRSIFTPVSKTDGQVGQRYEHSLENDSQFVFQPNAYHLIEVDETILLPDGVVANFVPVSEFALRGFMLVAGMLDSGYGELGKRTQKLFFGVKNLLDKENLFDRKFGLAHMSLLSLSGTQHLRQKVSDAEIERLADRHPERWKRAQDDGVFYSE